MTNHSLLLLNRPGCHLCEEFLDELRAAFPALAIVERDVDERPEWRERYGREIPVLLAPDGRVLCRTWFDAGAVRAYLARG